MTITGERCADQDYLAKIISEIKMVKPLDSEVSSQTIKDGLTYTISKTQENVQLVKAFQSTWNPNEGEVLEAYIHGQTAKGSGLGKMGSLIHLTRQDQQPSDAQFSGIAT